MSLPLFDSTFSPGRVQLSEGAVLLRSFALRFEEEILAALPEVVARSPFRFMRTPSGKKMGVALTSCGDLGWISDSKGYRYSQVDPATGKSWPPMPTELRELAILAASEAGFRAFTPDTCLINHYRPGTGLSLHQDLDEGDWEAPIVSVSLGIPAHFLFGGFHRRAPAQRIAVEHGDVIVFGGPDRMRFHGVMKLRYAEHRVLGARRINLSFRRAVPPA